LRFEVSWRVSDLLLLLFCLMRGFSAAGKVAYAVLELLVRLSSDLHHLFLEDFIFSHDADIVGGDLILSDGDLI